MKLRLFGIVFEIRPARLAKHVPRLPGTKEQESPKEASENFWRAFCHSGSSIQSCVCGRVHFAASDHAGWDWEEGELERLVEKSKTDPKNFIADYQNDSISWIDLGRGPVIWGCPCHFAGPYENFIWDYRDEILAYLKAKFNDLRLEESDLKTALDGVQSRMTQEERSALSS